MLFEWFARSRGEADQSGPRKGTNGSEDRLQIFVPFCGSPPFAGHPFDELNFFRNVRAAVVAKHFVKPDRRLAIDIRMLPRIPRQVRLCLTLHQPPVDHADMVNAADHHTTKEKAARSE